MVKEILLTQGKVAYVDDEDYELVHKYNWYACRVRDSHLWYAQRMGPERKMIRLHNFIMGCTGVDHADGDGLNCVRSNLRVASAGQQVMNTGLYRTNTSGFKGVSQIHNGKYIAYISINRKRTFLGTYNTAEEAAHARDKKAKELQGEFVTLNFPEEQDG